MNRKFYFLFTNRSFSQLMVLLLLLLASFNMTYAQELPFDPNTCGYACSAQDVIIENPFLSDINGNPIETCDGNSATPLVAYVSFTFTNTTGTDRYTPMIHAEVNNNGAYTLLSSCYGTLAAGESKIYTSPEPIYYSCGTEVFLENIWMGWNVTKKTCEDIAAATSCNKLIPSGKCGDYNNIPMYVKLPVDTPTVLGVENSSTACNDGIDNDGNGLIDCDDMSCAKYANCNYTETSSGNDGGLESNSRLLEKIAKRYYQRSKQAPQPIQTSANLLKKRSRDRMARQGSGVGLIDFMPLDVLEGATGYVSSPEDLNDLTNAVATLSVDYFEGASRKAVILATETRQGVYEHTKVICDRVTGTRLLNSWKIPFYGEQEMLISKLRRKDGTEEYSCSFSLNADGESLVVENYWNVHEYTADQRFYNFQVWASNTLQLQQLVSHILGKVRYQFNKPVTYRIGNLPEVYVLQSIYRNQELQIDIANPQGLKSVKLSGIRQATENAPEETISWTQQLSGATEESLILNTEGVYSIGITFSTEEGTPDTIFFADGVWNLDVDPQLETLPNFEVFQDFQSKNPEDWHIERGVKVQGAMNQKLVWYRALKNTFETVDISGFEGVSFRTDTKEAFELEIVLNNPQIAWENRVKTSVSVQPGVQEHFLSFEDFKADKAALENIHMLVFSASNAAGVPMDLNVEMRWLRFSASLETQPEISNPELDTKSDKILTLKTGRGIYQVQFNQPRQGNVEWMIFSNSGQTLKRGILDAQRGRNSLELELSQLSSGIYIFNLMDGNSSRQARILIN